jgi:nicotinate dehydrogenase subunit A
VTASCGAEPLLHLQVNGRACSIEGVPRAATLLHLLRNDLGLNGPKYGCGLGQCGACTVHVDGVAGRAITTLEGLGTRGRWHPVQAAFEDAQAAQCGYCLSGMVMQAAALLARDPQASEARIRSELSGNLCRCGTHIEILDAVQRAAVRMQEAVRP